MKWLMTLPFSKPHVKMMDFSAAYKKKKNKTQEKALLEKRKKKESQTQICCSTQRGCALDPTCILFPINSTCVHILKNAKNKCLIFIFSI